MYSAGLLVMANTLITEKIVPYNLLGMTTVTGLVDAVSFLSLGRVFTANMTGNVVILAFATARVPGLSIARSLTALLSFLVGAIFGGRIMARAGDDSQIRFAVQAFLLEVAFLFGASIRSPRYPMLQNVHYSISAALWLGTAVSALCSAALFRALRTPDEHSFQPFALIALTALAMGTRNAAVRKLAIPDLTTAPNAAPKNIATTDSTLLANLGLLPFASEDDNSPDTNDH
jgi:uncharacterized membrane protein YoaK (UPF0700 family)